MKTAKWETPTLTHRSPRCRKKSCAWSGPRSASSGWWRLFARQDALHVKVDPCIAVGERSAEQLGGGKKKKKFKQVNVLEEASWPEIYWEDIIVFFSLDYLTLLRTLYRKNVYRLEKINLAWFFLSYNLLHFFSCRTCISHLYFFHFLYTIILYMYSNDRFIHLWVTCKGCKRTREFIS